MSTFMSDVYSQAKKQKTTIVLPEGEDERTLVAAERILAEGLADLIIIGNPQAIASSGYDLSGATVVGHGDPRGGLVMVQGDDDARGALGVPHDVGESLPDDDVDEFPECPAHGGIAGAPTGLG